MNDNDIIETEEGGDVNTESDVNASAIDEKRSRKSNLLGDIFEYFELFIFSACAVLLLFSFVTRICRVDGPSMLNTLHDGEMLIVSDFFYKPERGDVIVFHQTGDQPGSLNEPIVKRIIATGGEWMSIVRNESGALTVIIFDENKENPVILEEEYANYDNGPGHYSYPDGLFQVPEGCLFVMGDNRGNSQDSRAQSIGFVDSRRVLGKVICRITPLSKFGKVN